LIVKETIDKIFDAAHIEEVVGDFVMLKKRGVNLLGLCPFHNEKSPSFTVSPAKGIYKCFGCGKGGNSVNFIMDHEQLSYPEALKYLAKKYHIEIEEDESNIVEQQENNNERESIYLVSAFAQKHFTENLYHTDEGKSIGLGYLKERGFREDIIEKFQLGYSLDKWQGFTNAALEAGYQREYLVKAGLTIANEEKTFDRFSGRVIFPIHNVAGRIIAFGGRTLKADKKTAKYINSPETEIYHKSKVLYGLYFAKKAIIAQNNCFLVEGYTDVISLFQAGIENVVASSGTSLTVEQIRLIRRYTPNITILYDGDNAGIKASFRGINLVLEEGMNVRVLLFPDGEDPDSFSKKVGSEELKIFIKERSVDFISFKTKLLQEETKSDPIRKAELIKDIVETITVIPDAIARSLYTRECSRMMDMSEQILITEINKLRRKKITEKKARETEQEEKIQELQTPTPNRQVEEYLLEESEAQERDIIRLLLNYGEKEIVLEFKDENDQPQIMKTTVALLIQHELSHDNIELENASYTTILSEYFLQLNSEKSLDNSHFTNHSNENIQKIVVDLISAPYDLSKNWLERHHIIVQTEEMQLKQAVYHAIFSLKIKKVLKMISENQQQLKNTNDEEKINQLLEQQQRLTEAKKMFSAELGRIILK